MLSYKKGKIRYNFIVLGYNYTYFVKKNQPENKTWHNEAKVFLCDYKQ